METMTFEELIQINCFSEEKEERKKAAELLEYRYGCEIRCGEISGLTGKRMPGKIWAHLF